jgi:hypothetical protein
MPINKNTYIYKLGHCPDLSVAEFCTLNNLQPNQENYPTYNFQWLVSDIEIDVNQTGSLIFGCEVLKSFDIAQKDDIEEALATHLEFNNYRKVGLYIPSMDKNKLFPMAKKFCNRVNIVDKLPNFGFWKQTNNWVITVKTENEIHLCKILSYSDQEFWGNVDQNLPKTDMNRGVINLKLARSMLNLSSNTNVWDNFAGQGRVLVAGMDLKTNFVASDIDLPVIKQLNENLAFASKYWQRTSFNKQRVEKVATLDLSTDQDATKEAKSEIVEQISTPYSIVTEGYLGPNFRREMSKEQVLQAVNEVNVMWKEVLNSVENLPINEIVGCLPFYPKLDFVPGYTFWNENSKWELVSLTNKHKTVQYKRENSNVGHLVFKLVRK